MRSFSSTPLTGMLPMSTLLFALVKQSWVTVISVWGNAFRSSSVNVRSLFTPVTESV